MSVGRRSLRAIKGKLSAAPRVMINSLRCDGAIVPKKKSVLASVGPEQLLRHVQVPVSKKSAAANLRQTTDSEWKRQLDDIDPSHPCFVPPVIISARSGWNLKDDTIEVFDRAVVVDGARRLEAALSGKFQDDVPIMVIFGLDVGGEKKLRNQIHSQGSSTLVIETERFDSITPRLVVDDLPVDLEVQSEPFVMPTARGYAPAILVRRDNAPTAEHLLVGAKSLSGPLETIRTETGSLKGSRIEVRKESAERSALYQVQKSKTKGR